MSEARSTHGLVIVAALVIIAAGIKAASEFLVPLLLAAFIATIAAAPVFWLAKRKVPEALAITAVLLTIVVVVFGVGALVGQSATAFTERLPFYQERINELVNAAGALAANFGVEISTELVLEYFNPSSAFAVVGTMLRSLGGVLTNSFLILLTVIFILAEVSSFPRKLEHVLSDPERDMPHFEAFSTTMNSYIAIKTNGQHRDRGDRLHLPAPASGRRLSACCGESSRFMLNYVPTIGSHDRRGARGAARADQVRSWVIGADHRRPPTSPPT